MAEEWIKFNVDAPPPLGSVIHIKGHSARASLLSYKASGYTNRYMTINVDSGANGSPCGYDVVNEYRLLDTQQELATLAKQVAGNPAALRQAVTGPRVYTVGADPEIFVTSQNGAIIPAFDFLPLGGKHAVKTGRYGSDSDGKLFADGFAAEINPEAGGCLSYVVDSAHYLLKELTQRAKGYELTNRNVFEIPQDIMGRCDDKQVALGCDPTYNVYGLQPDLEMPRRQFVRSAGGHMHFSLVGCGFFDQVNDFSMSKLTPEHRQAIEQIVKTLDATLGVMTVSLFAEFDDPRRRFHYGQAGEYRTPKYGVEYRTLSNAWLMHPVLMHMMFDFGRAAASFGMTPLTGLLNGTEQEVVQIIQDCDVEAARDYMRRNKAVLCALIDKTHLASTHLTENLAFEKFLAGAHTFIQEPQDIAGNWKISSGYWEGHSEGVNCSWAKARTAIAAGKMI
jgi:hypothetical protein